jgi:hypothetical protein
MARPKIYTDAAERSRVWQAKERARLRSLSPIQRLAESLNLPEPYTAEELETLSLIKGLSTELKRLTTEVNASLRERLASQPEYAQILRELETGYTRMELPNH